MAITLILHEASRTGAPAMGAMIARELARYEPVRVVAMKDGPLVPELRAALGPKNVVAFADSAFQVRAPFEERLRRAAEALDGDPADLIYANSLGASVFAFAAKLKGRKTILHVHEKAAGMIDLLAHDVAKVEVTRVVDALVLAADDMRIDLAQLFGFAPLLIETFGVAVDVAAVRLAGAAASTPPVDAAGRPWRRTHRLLVAMCGHASLRKGADIFLETALASPEADFVWIGAWAPTQTPDNIAYEDFVAKAPPNLFVTGATDNPHPYLATADLFFLSSREDPNPLVIGEALAHGKPVLAFSRATGVTELIGRGGLLVYGETNAADAARAIAACTCEGLRAPALRAAGDEALHAYDLDTKMTRLRALIARLRGETRVDPAPAQAARARALDDGAVELVFS
jgi:glycosyltransferase involved in cell wall biosynthesis